MYYTLIIHLNLYAKFSLGILDLCPNFIQFTIEKVDAHTQVVPSILKSFPTTLKKNVPRLSPEKYLRLAKYDLQACVHDQSSVMSDSLQPSGL